MERNQDREGDVSPLTIAPVEGGNLRPLAGEVAEQGQPPVRKPKPLHEGNRLSQNPM